MNQAKRDSGFAWLALQERRVTRGCAAWRTGSWDDFAALLAGANASLSSILRAFEVPLQDRADLLQDVMLAFVVKRSEIVSPEAWLRQALRLRCRQYRRDRARHRETSLDDAPEAKICEASHPPSHLRIDLERELARLPARPRSVLLLQFWLGFDAREVSQRAGLAPGSIRKTVSRGLSKLRRRLGRPG